MADFSETSLASQSGTKCRVKRLLAFLSLLSPPHSVSLFHFYCAHSMWILVSIFRKKGNGAVELKEFLCFRMGINTTERMHLVNDIIPSCLKTRMLILERSLNRLDLKPNMVGSFIFFCSQWALKGKSTFA